MKKLRIFYMLDGEHRYEDIDSKVVVVGKQMAYLDEHRMMANAGLYAECLKEVGARQIELRWS